MTPREISAELARLHGVAKTLIQSIELLKARVDALVQQADATVPPPTRPTTRIRKPTAARSVTSPELTVARDDRPTQSTSGAYRFVPSPKKR